MTYGDLKLSGNARVDYRADAESAAYESAVRKVAMRGDMLRASVAQKCAGGMFSDGVRQMDVADMTGAGAAADDTARDDNKWNYGG